MKNLYRLDLTEREARDLTTTIIMMKASLPDHSNDDQNKLVASLENILIKLKELKKVSE